MGEKKNMVDHPDHYNFGKYEPIDVIEDWDLGFSLGNAVKYIARANHKGKEKEDLEKALFYVSRAMGRDVGREIKELKEIVEHLKARLSLFEKEYEVPAKEYLEHEKVDSPLNTLSKPQPCYLSEN